MSTSPTSSPINGQQDLITYDVLVGPGAEAISDVYYIDSIEVTHQLNSLSRARITLYDGSPAKQEFENKESNDFVPGNEIIINLGYHRDNEEIFRGMVISTAVKVKYGQHTRLEVDCVSHAYKMTVGRKNKYFLKVKDSDIISQILNEYGSTPEKGSVDPTTHQYEEVIQYNATDWDFVLSRAEINGMIVDTSDNKVHVKKPEVSGSPALTLTFGDDLVATNLKLDGAYQLKAVEASSWDMAKHKIVTGASKEPSVNSQGDDSSVEGKNLAPNFSPDKVLLHTSTPTEEAALKAWANAHLLKSRLARIRGTLKCQGSFDIKPNKLVRIDGMGSYFNGDAFISGVTHTIESGNWTSEIVVGMDPNWFIESRTNIMAPSAGGLLPGIDGLYIGKVKKIDSDPNGETRIQVDVPVIEESGDGVWARLTSPYASKDFGHFFIPEVGDEVILGFLQNDPSFPVILGSVYSSKNSPPFTPDKDNSTKAIITKNKLELIFEDKKKNIILKTPAGNEINISDENGSITIKDKNQNKITMDSSGIEIKSPKDITLKATGKITLDATQKVEIKSKASDVAISGLNVKADAKIKVSNTGNMAELKGNAMTEIKGGIVRIN